MTDKLKNKLIVSVQAQGSEPLNKPDHLLAMSQSVINGGAGALRLCGIDNIIKSVKGIGDIQERAIITALAIKCANLFDLAIRTSKKLAEQKFPILQE